MPIQVTCACGNQCEFADQFAGWQAKCPACGGAVAVPHRGGGTGPTGQLLAVPRRKPRTALFVILGAVGMVVVAGALLSAYFLLGTPERREGSPPSSAALQPRAAAPQPESAPGNQPPQPTRVIPREQELQVLRLFGNYDKPRQWMLSVVSDSGPLDRRDDDVFLECSADTDRTLRTERWPDSFRWAAEHVAASKLKRHAYLTVFVSVPPDIASIVEVLGQPEATERRGFFRAAVPGGTFEFASAKIVDTADSGTVPLVWYHYGWLAFGTADGKVVAVRGDCRNITAAAQPAPAETAAAETPDPSELMERIRVEGIKRAGQAGARPVIMMIGENDRIVVLKGSLFTEEDGQFVLRDGDFAVNAGKRPIPVFGTTLKQGEAGIIRNGKCTKVAPIVP